MSAVKSKIRVFVPLSKVDEDQRLVFGRITQEILDKSGEVMDYASSKPNFEKWSNDIHTASNGLSKGNVRVMHGLNVAGKLTDIDFDDTEQAIDVCAKIVDDSEWQKVVEGCYTGFSVGGNYGKKWTETDATSQEKVKKFTAVPNEVSLVDNPCVPSATFTLVKADGAEEDVSFQVTNDDAEWPDFAKAAGDAAKDKEDPKDEKDPKDEEDPKKKKLFEAKKADGAVTEPSNDLVVKLAEDMAKAANDGSTWMAHIEAARNDLIKAGLTQAMLLEEGEEAPAVEEKADKEEKAAGPELPGLDKVTPPGIRQVWTASDGKTFEKKAEAASYEATLVKKELTETEKLAERLKKAVTPPVKTEGALILSIDRIDDLHKAVLELESPRDEQGVPLLEKGMYTVSRFANMIGDVANLARTIKSEGKLEDNDSEDENVSKALTSQLSTFGDSFMTYAKQQIAEMVAGLDTDISPRAAYDYYYRAAGEGNDLAKNVVELIEAVEEDYAEAVEKLAKFAPEPEEVEVGESLQKRFDALSSENADLRKIAEDAIDKVEDLAKRVKGIEDTPLPRAPRNIVEKTGDSSFMGKTVTSDDDKMTVLQEMLKKHSPDELATMMIKASQATGGHQLTLKSQ
jgi:hypothetical protein